MAKRKRIDRVRDEMGPFLDLLTAAETARFLRVSAQRVRQYIAEGRLPARKVAKVWVLKRQDVRDFAELERKNGRPRQSETEDRGTALSRYLERASSR